MKKYTYKRENFIYFKGDRAKIFLGGGFTAIMVCVALYCLFRGAAGQAALTIMVALPAFLLLCWGLRGAKKSYNKWHEKKEMMQHGLKMIGTVVDSGGHVYVEQEKFYNHSDDARRHTLSYFETDWWIEVEYTDPRDGEAKRFKAMNMNRKGKFLIGSRADVYLYKDHIYIDIP